MLEFRFASRKTVAILSSLFFLGIGAAPSNGAETGTQEAIEQTAQEFSTIKASAKEAVEKLDSALSGLREVEGRLKLTNTEKVLSSDNRAAILATIKKSRLQIARSKKILEDFQGKAGVVTDAFDAYDALVKFKTEYGAYQAEQGPLAADLYALGTAMEKAGKIPLLGDMIVAYGKLTTGMLTKIAAIAATIDENRNQGAISGPGYYKTGKGLEKYNVLKARNPTLAESVIYRPSIPLFVYTSDGLSDPKLIWDDGAKDFYFVAATVPLEKIFQMNLLAIQKRRTPFELNYLAGKWDSYYKAIDETATQLPALINAFRSGRAFDALMEIESKNQNIFSSLNNADLFEAKYVFDPGNPGTRENVRRALAELHALFRTKGLNEPANRLKVFAEKNGIDLSTATPAISREAAGTKMTYANFEGSLTSLAPSGGPCAFTQEHANKTETDEEITWKARCVTPRGDVPHDMYIFVRRYVPSRYCNTPERQAICWVEANVSAFNDLALYYDDSHGLRGDRANKKAWAVTIVDAKWPGNISAEDISPYSRKLSMPDLIKRLTDNYHYTEYNAQDLNPRLESRSDKSYFAIQAGNVHVVGTDMANKVPPVRVRPIVEAMLAKLPRNVGSGPPVATPPTVGRANNPPENTQTQVPPERQGSTSNLPQTPVPPKQAPATDPGQAPAVPTPPKQVQDVLDTVNKLKDVFRGFGR